MRHGSVFQHKLKARPVLSINERDRVRKPSRRVTAKDKELKEGPRTCLAGNKGQAGGRGEPSRKPVERQHRHNPLRNRFARLNTATNQRDIQIRNERPDIGPRCRIITRRKDKDQRISIRWIPPGTETWTSNPFRFRSESELTPLLGMETSSVPLRQLAALSRAPPAAQREREREGEGVEESAKERPREIYREFLVLGNIM